jgi:hypothetical protein
VSIALNPPNAKILYVATNDVVYKSGRILTSCMRERRKASFALRTKVSSGNGSGNPLSDPFISSILLHPRGPSQLYVGGPKGVWKILDGGKTWQAINQGIATLNICALAMNPKNPQILYAGTNGCGLYRSTDASATWTGVPLKAAPAATGSGQG